MAFRRMTYSIQCIDSIKSFDNSLITFYIRAALQSISVVVGDNGSDIVILLCQSTVKLEDWSCSNAMLGLLWELID